MRLDTIEDCDRELERIAYRFGTLDSNGTPEPIRARMVAKLQVQRGEILKRRIELQTPELNFSPEEAERWKNATSAAAIGNVLVSHARSLMNP